MGEPEKAAAKTINLAERRVFSQRFKPLYDEGMGLVERAAEYLDREGRAEAKKMSRVAATLYAAESMRLTTRLMQVASWLLLQRAVMGNIVIDHEEVSRTFPEGPGRVDLVAIYEVVDGLIRWSGTRWGRSVLWPVHDEIVAKVPEAEAEEATATLVEVMTSDIAGVPIVVEPSAPAFAWQDAA